MDLSFEPEEVNAGTLSAPERGHVVPFDLSDDLDDMESLRPAIAPPASERSRSVRPPQGRTDPLEDDDLDAVFRSIELDEKREDFFERMSQPPLLESLPELTLPVAPGTVPILSSARASSADDLEAKLTPSDAGSVVPELLDSLKPQTTPEPSVPSPKVPDALEAIPPFSLATFSEAPSLRPPSLELEGDGAIIDFDLSGETVSATEQNATELVAIDLAIDSSAEDGLMSFGSQPPAPPSERVAPAASGDDSGDGPAVQFDVGTDSSDAEVLLENVPSTGGDTEAELVLEGSEEIEVDASPADRGALLAASVTSRRKDDTDHERLFNLDARAEIQARAAMLVDEADHAATPVLAAEMLSLAADLYEGALGDRERARELATLAHALAPALHAPIRTLRRIEIAAGNSVAALELCDEELALALEDAERYELRLLAAELAALSGGDAAARWEQAAEVGGLRGALARIFAAGLSRDRSAMGDALEALAAETGGVLAASVDVARARLIEASEDQAALAAIRDAVRRDPSDTGAWLAMARIGLARSNVGLFREALAGLSRAVEGGAGARAADALRLALDAILGEAVVPMAVDGTGIEAWLVAHALRDAFGDPSPQVERSLATATDDTARALWLQWRAEAPGGHAARYAALQQAIAQRSDDAIARTAAAFLQGPTAGLVEAGLRAHGASVEAVEADLTGLGTGASGSSLRAALVAATGGIDAAEAVGASAGDSAWHMIARLYAQARAGQREEVRMAFEALAASEAPEGATTFARRATWLLGGDPSAVITALRLEAASAQDRRRGAGQRFMAACLAASAGLPGGGADALHAAEVFPGDLAVAEIAALHALRGETVSAAGADLLDAAAAAGDGTAARTAAVRAVLRRASSDSDAATESVWRCWSRIPNDASLGTLVLRTPSCTHERVTAVARALADAAWTSGRERTDAVVAVTTFLVHSLEQEKRFTEAAQVLARARSIALVDFALESMEERLWLRAGMYSEAAERAFDRLDASADNDQRLSAYERLAELDRVYRGHAASAVLSLQEILSIAPGHLPSLHALLRYFSEQGRYGEVLEVCRRFVEHVADPQDALAFAHFGARLAVLQADGDPFAGLTFYQAVRRRAPNDNRLLNALDAAARRAGNHQLFAELQLGLAESTSDAAARSVHLVRAADAFDALGDHGRALDCHARALEAWPSNLVARLSLARIAESLDDPRGAAEAWEAVGSIAATAEVAVRAWTRAAVLWRDRLGERTRCLAALRRALERDPSNREAFGAALAIVRDAGDTAGELELLERYAPDEASAPNDAASMHARAAEIAESQGDLARAVTQWRSVLSLEPENLRALRALARVARATNEWTVAADAMIRLAKTSTDTAERVELFYGLGEIFDEHIADPRRAEAAWRRVLALAPRDVRTLTRLADLYRRIGDTAHEADAVQSLATQLPPGPERTERLLRLAAIAEMPIGDMKRAQTALEVARRDNPSDLRVLRAFRSFYERNGNPAAAQALIDRAIQEVRRAIDLDPRDVASIARLSELLELRGQGDASRIAAAVAVALGSDDDRARAIAANGAVQGIGAAALTPDAIALLAPPAVDLPLRELLGRAAVVLEPLLPFDPHTFGATVLGHDDHPLRDELSAWARMLDLGDLEILVAPDVPAICMPVSRLKPSVLVSATREATPATRFAVARAMLLTALSLTIPVRQAVSEFTLTLGALLRQFDPMYRPEGVDVSRLIDLSARVTRAMPRELHHELAPFAEKILVHGVKDPETIRAGAHELGDRVALLATGDVAAGIALLSTGARRASESVSAIDRLLRVALSERFMEARRLAGADREAAR